VKTKLVALAAVAVLATGVAVSTAFAGQAGSLKAGSSSIVVSGFGSSTDDEAYEDFYAPWSKAKGIGVRMDGASQDIVAKLSAATAAGNVPWSLARAEQEDEVVLIQKGLLRPIPASLRKKLVRAAYPGGVDRYGVAFIDFTTVLVCNPKVAKRCPTTPKQFFDLKHFPGPRMMYANGWIDNLVLALEADGVPRNKLFPLDVNRALRKLDTIKGSIHLWWDSSGQSEQAMRDGEVAMGTIWNGRASLLADAGMKVSYTGSVANRELYVVPRDAPNPQAGFSLMLWYAQHPRAQAVFTAARRNALANPRELKYLPKSLVATLSTAPQNINQSVHLDFNWVVKNRDRVFKRWQDWVTR
jgi:putative spermidine/putrescine transport system substrate-binding protein